MATKGLCGQCSMKLVSGEHYYLVATAWVEMFLNYVQVRPPLHPPVLRGSSCRSLAPVSSSRPPPSAGHCAQVTDIKELSPIDNSELVDTKRSGLPAARRPAVPTGLLRAGALRFQGAWLAERRR